MPRHPVPGGILSLGMLYPRGGTLCLGTVYRGYTVPRHGVPPQGGYSMPRHRVPGGTRCLGTVYPPRGGTPCLGIVYRGVLCA